MASVHDVIGFPAGAGIVLSGLSWLYRLCQVAREVNKILSEDERLEWVYQKGCLAEFAGSGAEHERLLPESRTRAYACSP
jgi:hypothetical protein